jgi:hypothetical protein
MPKARTSKGFALVEILIIVVVLLALGAVGFYIYHRSHTKTATSGGTSSKASTQTNKNDTTSNSTTQPDKSIFKIPELGIKIVNVPTSLQDLTDASAGSDASGTGMYFSTQSLTDLAPACDASHGGLASMTRFNGIHSSNDGTLGFFIKQFDDFWIGYAPNRDQCWHGNDKAQDLESSQQKAFER